MAPDIQKGDGLLIAPDLPLRHGDISMGTMLDSPTGYGCRELRVVDVRSDKFDLIGVPRNPDNVTIRVSDIPLVDGGVGASIRAHSKSDPDSRPRIFGRVIQIRRHIA